MNFRDLETVLYIQLQISVISHVFRFVEQIRHQFLSGHPRSTRVCVEQVQRKRTKHVPRDREMFRRHGVIIMDVVEMSRVFEVALDYVSDLGIGFDLVQPEPTDLLDCQESEISDRQWLALCSGVQTVTVKVRYVLTLNSVVEVRDIWVVGRSVSLRNCGNATS